MRRPTILTAIAVTVLLFLLPAVASAAPAVGQTGVVQAPTLGLFGPVTWAKSAGGGFGDWQNSYPWSFARLNGDLYVGTGRVGCTSAVMSLMTGPMGGGVPLPLPGGTAPPQLSEFLSPDGTTVTDDAKYAAFAAVTQAEIWRLRNGCWKLVYQADMVPSYLRGASPFYLAPEIQGFRGMTVMTDKNGERAIYAAAGGFTFALKQPLMMRSTDGVTWTPVYAKAEMGRESRALWVHHGKLYVGVGYAGLGQPVAAGAWASNEPTNPLSWTKVIDFPILDPTNSNVVSFATFNGLLYLGTENKSGFQVWRSRVADPVCNGDWKRVVTSGAGHPLNGWAGTMRTFNGRLYVGSMSVPGITGAMAAKGFDLIRITPWDTWQLVVGDPRTVATPWGTRTLTPISGKASGFGNPVNLYCWSLEVFDGRLYLGTFDASTFLKVAQENGIPIGDMLGLPPEVVQVLIAGAGADLYRSWDGRCWTTVTRTGFGNPYNYGVRNMMAATPWKLYLGFSNPFYGCEMWIGRALW